MHFKYGEIIVVYFDHHLVFLSYTQTLVECFVPQKTAFSLKKPYFLPMKSYESLLFWIIFGLFIYLLGANQKGHT